MKVNAEIIFFFVFTKTRGKFGFDGFSDMRIFSLSVQLLLAVSDLE